MLYTTKSLEAKKIMRLEIKVFDKFRSLKLKSQSYIKSYVKFISIVSESRSFAVISPII